MIKRKAWLILGGLTLALSACGGGSHGRTAPTSIVPPAPPSRPPATTVPAAPPVAWSRDGDPALAVGGGSTARVAAALAPGGSGTWLVAGSRTAADGVPSATVWTSTNGTSWQATMLPSPVPGGQINAAAQYRQLRVVAGSVGFGASQRAAVWVSSGPGAPFQAATVPASLGPSTIDAIAVGELGFFASGSSGTQIGMWSSTNGVQWSESAAAEQLLAATTGARVNCLLAQGAVVYAGGSLPDANSTDAAVWSTSDGINWHLVDTAQPAFAGASTGHPGQKVILSLAPLGQDGMVAVGAAQGAGGWSPVSWISPNGASWSQPYSQFGGSPSGAQVRSVAATETDAGTSRLVATGGSASAQRVWQSTDGIHWANLPLPPSAARSSSWQSGLIVSSGSALLVADSQPGRPYVLMGGPAAWTEPSTNPETFGPVQPTATVIRMATNAGRLSLQAEVLTPSQSLGPAPAITPILLVSANGRTWSPGRAGDSSQPAKLPAGATISARDGTGWVAAGRLAQAATVWTSTDGVHWRRAATLVGAGARPRGICVGPAVARPGRAQLTVVGSVNVQPSGTAAAAWTAVDGVHWGRAVLSPAPVVGIDESVDGCEAAAGGFLGYGSTAGSGGLVPAVWKSASGQAWSLDAGAGFAAGSPAPLTGMARSGGLALAVGRSSQGGSGLWLSTDGGGTWPIVTTTSPPWDGYQKASFEAVGVIADELVVTGSVDGRLAAWLGTPAA